MMRSVVLVTLAVLFQAAWVSAKHASSPYQTHDQTYNSTDPNLATLPSAITLRASKSQVNHSLEMLETNFKDIRNASKQPHLRSMFNLKSMIGCATNCNRLYLTWYGNYCGWGGSGYPIDNIDRCCQWHDSCYAKVMKDYHKWRTTMYLGSYNWDCDGGNPACGWHQDEWKLDACFCDIQFTQCLNESGCPKWF